MVEQQPRTRVVRTGISTDPHRAVVPPIYLSTTYGFAGLEQPGEYNYSRACNPTRSTLAQAVAELEGGLAAVITSSGDFSSGDQHGAVSAASPFRCAGGPSGLLRRFLAALRRAGTHRSAEAAVGRVE